MRYHRSVYFPDWAQKSLESLALNLNWRKVIFSNHVLDKLCVELRPISREVRDVISGLWIDSKDIFEFEGDENGIDKICYRIEDAVRGKDLILVINHQMVIITLYLNNPHDFHESLNRELYTKGEQ